MTNSNLNQLLEKQELINADKGPGACDQCRPHGDPMTSISDLVQEKIDKMDWDDEDAPWVAHTKNDINQRKRVGLLKYGEELRPFNDRNALIDAYQETIDGALYLKQASYEGHDTEAMCTFLVQMSVEIRKLIG